MAARMSFVDVFPVEPVIATTVASLRSRTARPRAASAVKASSGTSAAAAPTSHRVADEGLAVADGDEEVARGDAPGVDLHARRDGRSGSPLQAARAESLDLVELQRDHVRAASRRRA